MLLLLESAGPAGDSRHCRLGEGQLLAFQEFRELVIDHGTHALHSGLGLRGVTRLLLCQNLNCGSLQDKVWAFEVLLRVREHVGVSLEYSVLVLDDHIDGDRSLGRAAKRRFRSNHLFDLGRFALTLNKCSISENGSEAHTSIRVVARVE